MKDSTIRQILQFSDERDWKQFHNPKDLSISISLEAAELLENFQWSGAAVECKDKIEQIREELADVFIYSVLMADACELNIDEIILDKIRQNTEKYPVEKSCGNSKKYTELKSC